MPDEGDRQQRERADPAADREPEAEVGDQVAGIGRVADPAVGTAAVHHVTLLDDHVSLEVAAEAAHRPDAQRDSAEGDRHAEDQGRPGVRAGPKGGVLLGDVDRRRDPADDAEDEEALRPAVGARIAAAVQERRLQEAVPQQADATLVPGRVALTAVGRDDLACERDGGGAIQQRLGTSIVGDQQGQRLAAHAQVDPRVTSIAGAGRRGLAQDSPALPPGRLHAAHLAEATVRPAIRCQALPSGLPTTLGTMHAGGVSAGPPPTRPHQVPQRPDWSP